MHECGYNENEAAKDQAALGAAGSPQRKAKANCDQEAWVKARIKTAIEMALAIRSVLAVGAEEGMKRHAIDGIVNGAAIEVIRTLGLEPEFTNLREYPNR